MKVLIIIVIALLFVSCTCFLIKLNSPEQSEKCPHEICSCPWRNEWTGIPSSEWDIKYCTCISTEEWKQKHDCEPGEDLR